MKVYVVFANGQGGYCDDDCDGIEKIFSSREAAERHIRDDAVSDLFSKVEVADCPGVAWYYFMERPAYRIEEHCVED